MGSIQATSETKRRWFRSSPVDLPEWGAVAALLVGIVLVLVAQTITYILLNSFVKTDQELVNFILLQATLSSGIIPVAAYVRYRMKKRIFSSLLINKVKLSDFIKLLKAIGMYFVIWIVVLAAIILLAPEATEVEQNVGITSSSSLTTLVAGFVGIVIITPVIEEMIFRGFLFRGIAKSSNFWIAALGSSLIFGFAHGQLVAGVDTFIFGVVACALVSRTGSLWPAIAFHGLKNAAAFYIRFIEPML